MTPDDAALLAAEIAHTWRLTISAQEWWTQQLRTLDHDDACNALVTAQARYRTAPDGPTWRQFRDLAEPARPTVTSTGPELDRDGHNIEIARLRQTFKFLNH